jgi:hypothetical protein
MQTIIVILIIVVTVFFLIRRFHNSVKSKTQPTCGCGCNGCNPAIQRDNCSDMGKGAGKK